MQCAPQRYLSNLHNAIRTAILTPSSVLPVADQVLAIPVARKGTAQVSLTGSYTGAEEAVYDVEVLDTTVSTKLASAPVFAGAGSGTLTGIAATTFAAQEVTVELKDAGIPTTFAGVDFEGVRIRARAVGAVGNGIHINVSQAGLVFTSTPFSLLTDLRAGQGDENSGLTGAAFDFNAAVLGADNLIPSTAKRIAFGDDTSAIYLQYKKFADGEWSYHFVPALKRDVPKGTPVKFVTGGRTVVITDGVTPESYPSIVTLYDLLNVIKTTSVLVTVDGVVANDRSPTGQASRELLFRTDAHVEPSSGSGSAAATGFADAFANANAKTELVTATCFAVTQKDYPLAHLGHEYWQIKGSLSGDLGLLPTDTAFIDPTDNKFGFTIPTRLPPGFGTQKGRFEVTGIVYQPRAEGEISPPICVASMSLGPNAVDQTITLKYTRRPTGDCSCDAMPKPNLNTPCLGNPSAGGDTMGYQADTVGLLRSFYSWKYDAMKKMTALAKAFEARVIQTSLAGTLFSAETFEEVCNSHEQVLAQIDQLPTPATPIAATSITVGTTTTIGFAATTAPTVGVAALASGFTGADAAAFLNGKTGVILSSTTTQVVLDIDTSGKAITFTGGKLTLAPERANGIAEWSTAVAAFEADMALVLGTVGGEFTVTAIEAITQGQPISIFADGDLWKASVLEATPTGLTGFAKAAISAGATGIAKLFGVADGLSALTDGATYYPQAGGTWGTPNTLATYSVSGVAVTASKINVTANFVGLDGEANLPLSALISDRYETKLQHVLICAGLSPLGKADANTLQSGDGCWKDYGGDFWWEVVGSEGAYAPGFTNHPLYSCRKAEKDGKYYSTHEWALQINIKESCVLDLKEGDEIDLVIGAAAYGSTYQIGDVLTLPVLAAQDLFLAGGQNGNAILVWYVTGSVTGALPVFTYDPGSPAPYASGGLAFTLTVGGIPFAKGDKFKFSIEGGHFQWRKNGGSWSSSTAIPAAPTALDAGLSITFTPGASPSFVVNDTYSFRALQPWAVSNSQSPSPGRWQSNDTSPTLDADLGSVLSLDMLAIAFHTLPSSCTITVAGGLLTPTDWTETLTWQKGVIAKPIARSARYLRLTLTGAGAGTGVGWFWAGAALTTFYSADTKSLRRSYNMARGEGGLYQGGRHLASTVSGQIQWQEGFLTEADYANIVALLDWLKENGDEPLIFLPQVTRPQEAFPVRVNLDDVDLPDLTDYNADAAYNRKFSASLPLAGVWR